MQLHLFVHTLYIYNKKKDFFESFEKNMTMQKKTERNSQTTIEFDDVEILVNQNTLLEITLINSFVCEFATAIENVWITTLLIQFQTEKMLDSFMWIIPNILSIIIIPYLDAYINKFKVSLMKYLSFIMISLLFAALGHYLVILSTIPEYLFNIQSIPISYHYIRIIISIIGWTIIDMCIELVNTYNQSLKAFMIQRNIKQEIEEEESIITLAKFAAYGLTFLACNPHFSFRNLHIECSRMYYISGLICLTGSCLIYAMNKIKITKGLENEKNCNKLSASYIKQSIKEVKLTISTFFPGFWETIWAPVKLKIILLQFFTSNCIVDIIYIYCSIWITRALVIQDFVMVTSEMFMLGIKYGGLLLFGFSLLAHVTKKYYRPLLKNLSYKIAYFSITFITFFLTTYTALEIKVFLIALIVLFGGIFSSLSELYLQQKQDSYTRYFPNFQKCKIYISIVQKLVVLCGVPFYWRIWKDSDHIFGCLWFCSLLSAITLLILLYDLATAPHTISKKKQ